MASSTVSSIGSGTNSQDLFIQLLVAQLRNQDPLNPVSSQEFITQLSSLSTVQGLQSLNASFSEVLKLQQFTQGTDLIGKTVEYTPAGGGSASGKVDALTAVDGKFQLQIGQTTVGLDQVTRVKA